jgi:hypothetical protein
MTGFPCSVTRRLPPAEKNPRMAFFLPGEASAALSEADSGENRLRKRLFERRGTGASRTWLRAGSHPPTGKKPMRSPGQPSYRRLSLGTRPVRGTAPAGYDNPWRARGTPQSAQRMRRSAPVASSPSARLRLAKSGGTFRFAHARLGSPRAWLCPAPGARPEGTSGRDVKGLGS